MIADFAKRSETQSEQREESNALRPEVQSQLTPFLQTVAQSAESALLLDYDGTLAPFHVHAERDKAFPYPGVTHMVQEIVRHGRTRVIVISGRDARDLVPLLNVRPRPEVWGIHGLQRLRTNGTTEMPRLDPRTLVGLSDADRWLGYQELRSVAEFKAGSIAVHWRGLTAIEAEDLRSRVMLGWRPIAEYSGLDLLQFDGGVEIRAAEADKGEAVRSLLKEIGPETPVAYLGDDSSDESAFKALGSRGLSVLVRPVWRETNAQMWLKPPEELLDFLGLWLKARGEGGAAKGNAARAVNG